MSALLRTAGTATTRYAGAVFTVPASWVACGWTAFYAHLLEPSAAVWRAIVHSAGVELLLLLLLDPSLAVCVCSNRQARQLAVLIHLNFA